MRSAHYFIGLRDQLPEHEVAYEHVIVALLLNLLIDAWRITADPLPEKEITERLPWLLASSGRQPHIRLHGFSIRHWDGCWSGQDRLFGDVFPHYWSVLTSSVLYHPRAFVLRTHSTSPVRPCRPASPTTAPTARRPAPSSCPAPSTDGRPTRTTHSPTTRTGTRSPGSGSPVTRTCHCPDARRRHEPAGGGSRTAHADVPPDAASRSHR